MADHLDTTQDLPSGFGNGVPATSLVQELLRRGHRVVVATLSPDVADDIELAGPDLRVHVGPYRREHRARDAFRAERRAVRRALLRARPSVVHAHWSYEFALGALASGAPTLVTLHDWAPTILRFHRDAYRAVRLGMHVATLARGQHVSAVSPYLARAAERWRVDAEVVPNGLADRWFAARPRELRADAPTLVSVITGFGERKNSTTLLRAYARLRNEHPASRLVLIGDGHQPDGPAARWAAAEGLVTGVDFKGPLPYERTMAEIADADVLVHPALEESFGLTLIEAMAQGTPVIGGARSGAVPWVLAEGEAGALADVASPHALAATMQAVLSDPTAWGARSRRGYEHASTNFRLSHVTDRYLELYERIRRRGG